MAPVDLWQLIDCSRGARSAKSDPLPIVWSSPPGANLQPFAARGDDAQRLRVDWAALTGRRADDGRSARLVVLMLQVIFRLEAVGLGVAAAGGRGLLGSGLLNVLAAPPSLPGLHMTNISEGETAAITAGWLATAAVGVTASITGRRALRLNDPIAAPPVRDRVRPVTASPLLLTTHLAMMLPLVLLCFFVQRVSRLWDAYLWAEGILMVVTILYGLRRAKPLTRSTPPLPAPPVPAPGS